MNPLFLVEALACALIAATGLFAGSRHAPAWLRARRLRRGLWPVVLALLMCAVLLASKAIGVWPAVFLTMVALMLGCALWPYVHAWLALKRRLQE